MKNIKKLFNLLDQSQKKIIFFFIPLTLVLILFETFSISLIIPIISNVLLGSENNEVFKINKIFDFIFGQFSYLNLIFLLLFSYIVKNIYFIFYNIILFKFSNSIQLKFSAKLLKTYLEIPYIDFIKKNSAELLRNIQSECAKIRNGIRHMIILFSEFLILLSIIYLILLVDTSSAVTVFVYMIIVVVVYFFIFRRLITKLGFENLDKNKKLIKSILESLAASKIIRLYSKQKFYIDKFQNNLELFLKNNIYVSTLGLVPKIWIEIFSVAGICIMMYYLSSSKYNINYLITYLGFISFAIIRIIPSILRISNSYQSLKYSSAAIKKIESDLNLLLDLNLQKEKNKLIFKNQIKLKNFILKFKPNNNLILDNIDLEINKNESIFIKGESGSGKTSLINLISGIYTPESGDYFLNGKKIENNNISPLTNLGYVTQDTFIFDENIKKNIAIGLHNYEIKLDKINDLIKKVELESFINNLEHGLDTIVGERGARISGGQAQRIGIARALYNDPDILILDEATNSLDKENEFKILKILKKLKDQITIVMISHNPIENIIFDKTYELKNGKLIKIS